MKVDSKIGLLDREKEVLRLIELFKENNLRFIVVGGYAVSTYKKRFSVDLDIVIKEDDLIKFEKLLLKEGYSISYQKEIALVNNPKSKTWGMNDERFI